MALPRSGPTRSGRSPELLREGYTMALYVSIVLFAALLAIDDSEGDHDTTVMAVVLGTTIGLALAHWFAFSVAARLIGAIPEGPEPARLLKAQLSAAALVAGIAIIPVIVLPDSLEQLGALVALAVFIAAVVFKGARDGGLTTGRAAASAILALIVFVAIALIKNKLATH